MENRAGDYPPGELPVASCLFFGGRVEVRSIVVSMCKVDLGGEGRMDDDDLRVPIPSAADVYTLAGNDAWRPSEFKSFSFDCRFFISSRS